jgi:hypothetical protein
MMASRIRYPSLTPFENEAELIHFTKTRLQGASELILL